MSVVPYVVADHISNPAPEKPLVLTFVGPTGVGKSFLVRIPGFCSCPRTRLCTSSHL